MKSYRLIVLAPLAAAAFFSLMPGCSTISTDSSKTMTLVPTATIPPAPTNTPVNTNTAGPSQTATVSRTASGTFTASPTATQTNTPCSGNQCTCPPTFSPTAAATAPVVINEVFSDGTATGQWAEIKNVGGNPVTFTNFTLCQWPTYWPFPAGFTLAPGAFVVVHYNQSGTDTGTDLYTGALGANLATGSGELGLYDCSGGCVCFTGSACIRDYIEWGNGGHQREPVAVGAGVWFTGSFASVMSGGMSLNLVAGSPGNLGCHYQLASPSPGS